MADRAVQQSLRRFGVTVTNRSSASAASNSRGDAPDATENDR